MFEEMPRLNLMVRQRMNDKSFHFIADVLRTQTFDDAYVDNIHYGDTACLTIAQAIAASLRADGLVG